MNLKICLSTLAVATMLAACETVPEHGAYLPENGTKYNQEKTAKFVTMDPGAQKSVTAESLQVGATADGRLKVAANVRNRENRRIQVQVSCDFKDEQGFAIDSTPWQNLILTENEIQTVPFETANKMAKNFTIKIREAR
jgi:uncharacterized protein YcfL